MADFQSYALGGLRPRVYLQFEVKFNAAYKASLVGVFADARFATLRGSGGVQKEAVDVADDGSFYWIDSSSKFDNFYGHDTADTWHTVTFSMVPTGQTPEFTVDGDSASLVLTWVGSNIQTVEVGLITSDGALAVFEPGAQIRIRNVTIGSTLGASDYADDPTEYVYPQVTPLPRTGGVRIYVAFSDPALKENPSWTGLHTLAGVGVQTFEIKRGRPSEREKTGIGTATITGIDTAGSLDPTNPGVVAAIVPNKQVRIDLHDPVASSWTTIYRGFVRSWTYTLDLSETVFDWTLECKDALGILSDAEMIPDVAGNTVPLESTGDVYYDPQQGQDRVLALLADAALSVGVTEWPAGLTSIFTLNISAQGTVYSPRTSILQGLDDVCDAEFPGVANRYADKRGRITVHGRLARFDPTNPDYEIIFWKIGDQAAFAGDSATAVISPLEFEVSEDNLINAALATPTGIADADISGQFVKDATSIAAYGARSISYENLITQLGHDSFGVYNVSKEVETKKVASYYVDNFKTPQARVSQVTILHRDPTDPRAAAAWGLLCGVEISDVATLTTSHPGDGGFAAVDFFVEGIGYRGVVSGHSDYAQVTLTLDISPRAYFDTNPYG